MAYDAVELAKSRDIASTEGESRLIVTPKSHGYGRYLRLGNKIWANTLDSIPIHLPVGVEEGKVLAEIVDQLQEIAQKIATP